MLRLLLEPIAIPTNITAGGALTRHRKQERIDFLAAARNALLPPVGPPWAAAVAAAGASAPVAGPLFAVDDVLFINDVLWCAGDAMRLLLVDADFAAAVDFGWVDNNRAPGHAARRRRLLSPAERAATPQQQRQQQQQQQQAGKEQGGKVQQQGAQQKRSRSRKELTDALAAAYAAKRPPRPAVGRIVKPVARPIGYTQPPPPLRGLQAPPPPPPPPKQQKVDRLSYQAVVKAAAALRANPESQEAFIRLPLYDVVSVWLGNGVLNEVAVGCVGLLDGCTRPLQPDRVSGLD